MNVVEIATEDRPRTAYETVTIRNRFRPLGLGRRAFCRLEGWMRQLPEPGVVGCERRSRFRPNLKGGSHEPLLANSIVRRF